LLCRALLFMLVSVFAGRPACILKMGACHSGFGFRVSGSGFRVSGCRIRDSTRPARTSRPPTATQGVKVAFSGVFPRPNHFDELVCACAEAKRQWVSALVCVCSTSICSGSLPLRAFAATSICPCGFAVHAFFIEPSTASLVRESLFRTQREQSGALGLCPWSCPCVFGGRCVVPFPGESIRARGGYFGKVSGQGEGILARCLGKGRVSGQGEGLRLRISGRRLTVAE